MMECFDDIFTFDESSLLSTFFDDQYLDVEHELALLAVDISDKDSLVGTSASIFFFYVPSFIEIFV